MDLNLRGKVAVVAAASQGLGRASALELSREGARVAICSRDEGRIREAAKAIAEETGGEILPVVADLTKAEDARTFVRQAVDRFGRVDILFTNAGGPPPGEFEELGDPEWELAHRLTLMSAVRLIREALPHMNEGGRVVLSTSLSVKQPFDNLILSNSLRMAVVGMAKSLVKSVAKRNITVNVVSPGYIMTDRVRELLEAQAKKQGTTAAEVEKGIVGNIPLGRTGETREFGELIAFLASERASYLTGTVIQIDGGLYRGVY